MLYQNAELYNVQFIQPDGDGIRLSRVPEHVLPGLEEGARTTAFFGCGTELRFVLEGEDARITLRRLPYFNCDPTGVAEVYYGDFAAPYTVTPCYVGGENTAITVPRAQRLPLLQAIAAEQGLGFDPAVVRVRLPYDTAHALVSIEGDIRPPAADMVPARRYLAYGSSITHGGGAVRPGGGYAMQLARNMGCDLIDLGFAGSARMEPAIAEYIAGRQDWEFATLELGINVFDIWDTDSFAKKAKAFVDTIASAHPDKWIFCTDQFLFYEHHSGSEKLANYKRAVEYAVKNTNSNRIVYTPGEELLRNWQGLGADLLHPCEEGMAEIAANWQKIIRSVMM